MNLKFKVVSLAILSLTCALANADLLSRRQARSYIENVTDTLFATNDHTQPTISQIDNFKERASEELLGRFSHNVQYNTNRLYKSLLNKAVNFVESRAVRFAREKLADLAVSYDRDLITAKVASKVNHDVNQVINKCSTLPNGALSKFIGSQLRKTVDSYVLDELDALDRCPENNYRPCRVVNPVVRRVYYEDEFPARPVIVRPVVVPACPVVRPYVYCEVPRAYFSFGVNFNI